jgi:NADH dehydrogenase [ubiquinone] 1 alpha subcomplex assembly factor 7
MRAEAFLAELIHHQGSISVAQFMDLALYHQDFGYYRHQQPIGRAGDFITAPEVSQVFGELIGLWCIDLWQKMGQPAPIHLIELGPGRGTLMRDLLNAAKVMPAFLSNLNIHLVEVSESLKAIQQKTLVNSGVTWHQTLETVPQGSSIFIANEFFDALPIQQLIFTANQWQERGIDITPAGDFIWTTVPASIKVPLEAGRQGEIREYCPLAQTILRQIAKRFSQNKGAALIIDYGYTQPILGNTLQAMHRHAYHDILKDMGKVDLTAQVDFANLCKVLQEEGSYVCGPILQGDFLVNLGIELRTEHLCQKATPEQAMLLKSGTARLVSKSHMGHFRVLAATSSQDLCPAGFEESNDKEV